MDPHRKCESWDTRHMQSRCEMFRCTHPLVKPGSRPSRGSIPQCRHHLAKWVYDAAVAFDASQVLQSTHRNSHAVNYHDLFCGMSSAQ